MPPAAISARPATTTSPVLPTAPESPAASANGTVSPSDIPITTSRTVGPPAKCPSACVVLASIIILPGQDPPTDQVSAGSAGSASGPFPDAPAGGDPAIGDSPD